MAKIDGIIVRTEKPITPGIKQKNFNSSKSNTSGAFSKRPVDGPPTPPKGRNFNSAKSNTSGAFSKRPVDGPPTPRPTKDHNTTRSNTSRSSEAIDAIPAGKTSILGDSKDTVEISPTAKKATRSVGEISSLEDINNTGDNSGS